MATYGLRSSRSNGRGAVHAPHPGFAGKDQRPLCPAITKWGHGIWWNYTSDQVTCRACLKLLGKEPAPKRMSAKAAVNKVLRDLGLRPKWDFSTHDHLFPMDQSGGFRSVEYTTVTIYGDEPKQKVIDNAKAIVEVLWTNKFGRHPFSVWVREMPSGGIWVEIDTDNMYDIYRAKKPECRRVATYWDLPDRELYWGEEPEPADKTPEKETEAMTAQDDLVALVRRDDAAASRAAFTKMVVELGREEASTRWAAATAAVAEQDPMNPPSMVAPDCDMACGESYLDPGCNPCVTLENIRHPKAAVQPFRCACGFEADNNDTDAVFDHVDTCDQFGES